MQSLRADHSDDTLLLERSHHPVRDRERDRPVRPLDASETSAVHGR